MNVFNEMAYEEDELTQEIDTIAFGLENYKQNNFSTIFKNRGKSKKKNV